MDATIDDLRTLIQPGDLHLVASRAAGEATLWRRTTEGGDPLFKFTLHNTTVNAGPGHWGYCPAGSYLLGAPSDCHAVSLGFHFTPVFDLEADGPLHANGRVGIGIHGGGTGLPDPFAPEQGWVETEGCWRAQNADNEIVVGWVREAQRFGRHCYFTVTA